MYNPPNNRLKILIIIVVISVLGIIAFFLLTNRSTKLQTTSVQLPDTVQRFGDTSFVFSNGRTFVSYDYEKKTIQKLSTSEALPLDITDLSVSADKNYLLFKARRQYYDDTLGQKLIANNVEPSFPRWWVYNISAGSYDFIPGNVYSATFNGQDNSLVVLSPANPVEGDEGDPESTAKSTSLQTFSLPSITRTSSLETGDYTSARSIGGTIYLQSSARSLDTIDLKTGDTKKALSDVGSVAPSASQPFAIIKSLVNQDKQSTKLFDTKTGKTKNLGSAPKEGFGACWSPDGSTLYYQSGSDIKSYDVSGSDGGTYKLKGLEKGSEASITTCLGKGAFIVESGSEKYVAAATKVTVPIKPASYKKVLSNGTSVEFSSSNNSFLVSVVGSANDSAKAAVYNQLTQDGIMVDFWPIRFTEITSGGSFAN